jgi:hypothetical protein
VGLWPGHCEVLGKQNGSDVGCAAIMIVVGRFANPDMLVEIKYT